MDVGDITVEKVGGAVFGLSSLWALGRKLLVKKVLDDTVISSAEASTDVIEMLRCEVRRLGEINNELAEALNNLQRENIGLCQEIAELHITVNRMSAQIENDRSFDGVERRRNSTT